MRFGLLGVVGLENRGAFADIKPAKQRAILAVLLVNANTAVPVQTLVETLWPQSPPATAKHSLLNHVMRLRRLLGDQDGTLIRAVPHGYQIEVGPGELDLDVFTDLCAAGQEALREGRWADAADRLASALALCRGPLAADVPALARHPAARRFTEARLQAVEGRAEADLELGRHRDLADELRALVAEHPVRESFHTQLLLALYRSDRRAEALDVFESLRRTLDEELGTEPSASAARLHRRILADDPGLAPPAHPGPATAAAPRGRLNQLPTDIRDFTGYDRELAELAALAGKAPVGSDAGMVVISAIDGMGGIGKTTLAVHAAHRARELFPDGQLFLDLHGYSADIEPLTAADALDFLLRSLGVPPQLIRPDLGERSAQYRDRLAGTRTLIILDNATSAAQIRPLLPGAAGCLVLVTSRRRLTSLEDAHFLALTVLSAADALALLHKVAGPGRIPAHHPGAAGLVELCGRMPLAVRLIAARLRHHPELRIEDLAAQLRDERTALDQFGDEDRELAAAFDLSYRGLPEPEQRMFRLLGLNPGPDTDAYAAANLAGTDLRTAERLLESLLDHNLLTQHTHGRYRFHDLIRVYARTLADQDAPADRDSALDRLLDYYRHVAARADQHLAHHSAPVALPDAGISRAMPVFTGRTEAMGRLRADGDNLLAAASYLVAHGQAARTVALAAALAAFLSQEGHWRQALALHQAAADFARDLGDAAAEANALRELARIRCNSAGAANSVGLFERVLEMFQELGDRLGEANGLWDLGRVRRLCGDYPTAAGLLERALEMYRELGDRLGEANTLWDLGRVRRMTGDYPATSELQKRSLEIYRELGNQLGEANALFDLSRISYLTGDYPAASDLLEQSLVVYREIGNRIGEANALFDLGRVRQITAGHAAAAELQERSLALHRELGNRLGVANCLWDLGRLRLLAGNIPAAADLLEQALASYREAGSRLGEAGALHELGRTRHAAGDLAAAADLLDQALVLYRELRQRQSQSELFTSLGALLSETAGPREALAAYTEALRFAGEASSPVDEAHALEGMAGCSEQLGDLDEARSRQREAVAVYRRIGAAEAAGAERRLAALEASG